MNKLLFQLALMLILLLWVSCGKDVEKLSDQRPLAVEVTKVRSYYHAQNIKERLEEKGLQPYVLATSDSTEGGKWYSILVGAKKDSSELETFSQKLKGEFDFDSLKVVNYAVVKDEITEVIVEEIKEKQKIDAERPELPQKIYDVITKFPQSNMFYVRQMYVFNTPENNAETKMFSVVKNIHMDLPRGVSSQRLLDLTAAFAEVIYEDNIYGDRVTLDILKLKSNHGIVPETTKAGFLVALVHKSNQLAIANYFADLILETGDYLTEEKTEISVSSFRNLVGYKTVIEPTQGYIRTYLILVDELGEYVIFCQSTDKSEEELHNILSLVGQSTGMLEYDEFYNTFFTLPKELQAGDHFVGFYIDKLDWSYAKSKRYAKWAKEYVGHWAAHALFYNDDKGLWTYGIFDLLTEDKVNYTQKLYAKKTGEGKEPIKVYGQDGFFISNLRLNYETFKVYRHAEEVNFPIHRYVCMVDNTRSSRLSKEDLIARANSFQFQKGGYTMPDSTDEDIAIKQ